MRSKKLMALPVLLIFALSVAGYAFANWTETLTINGSVTTATLDLTFKYIGPVDELGTDPYNVATTTLDPSGMTTGTVHLVTMIVNNAYLGYKVLFTFQIKNIGTIPAKFVGFNLNSGPTSYSNANGWSASLAGGELTFQAFDGEGEMMPVGGSHTYSLELDVTTAAQSGTTYTFTVGVVFEQGV